MRRLLPPLVTVAVLAASFWLGSKVERAAPEQAAAPAATVEGHLGGVDVLTQAGALVPLAPSNEPAVIMISSESCGYCMQAMRDLASMAGGQPLAGLRIVSLEGAEGGSRMAARAGLRGAMVVGPADHAARTIFTFQIPGTPTFLLVEPGGSVTSAMPGYPGKDALIPWFRVMTGVSRTL